MEGVRPGSCSGLGTRSRGCDEVVHARIVRKAPRVRQRIIYHAGEVAGFEPGTCQRGLQLLGRYEPVPLMGARRNPAQHVFGTDNCESIGFQRPIQCRQDHDTAFGRERCEPLQEGRHVRHVLDDFEEEDGVEAAPLIDKRFGGRGLVMDREPGALRMGLGRGDGLSSGVDACDLGPKARQRFGDETAPAANIQHFEAFEAGRFLWIPPEVRAKPVANIGKPCWVELMKRPEWARLVPPLFGQGRELGDLARIEGRRRILSGSVVGSGHGRIGGGRRRPVKAGADTASPVAGQNPYQ